LEKKKRGHQTKEKKNFFFGLILSFLIFLKKKAFQVQPWVPFLQKIFLKDWIPPKRTFSPETLCKTTSEQVTNCTIASIFGIIIKKKKIFFFFFQNFFILKKRKKVVQYRYSFATFHSWGNSSKG